MDELIIQSKIPRAICGIREQQSSISKATIKSVQEIKKRSLTVSTVPDAGAPATYTLYVGNLTWGH